MALILGKLKCFFCEKKEGVLYSVHQYGIYGDVGGRIFYHTECLEMVQLNPEKYGHNWADKAIQIDDLFEKNREKCNNNLAKDFQKKVDKLHQSHFERMMPRKRHQ